MNNRNIQLKDNIMRLKLHKTPMDLIEKSMEHGKKVIIEINPKKNKHYDLNVYSNRYMVNKKK